MNEECVDGVFVFGIYSFIYTLVEEDVLLLAIFCLLFVAFNKAYPFVFF